MTRYDLDSCQGQLLIKPIASWDKNVHIHPFEEKKMKIERHDKSVMINVMTVRGQDANIYAAFSPWII